MHNFQSSTFVMHFTFFAVSLFGLTLTMLVAHIYDIFNMYMTNG